MPLIKSSSDDALSKNIAREMDAGKSQDQAVAISKDVQRTAGRRGPRKYRRVSKTRVDY